MEEGGGQRHGVLAARRAEGPLAPVRRGRRQVHQGGGAVRPIPAVVYGGHGAEEGGAGHHAGGQGMAQVAQDEGVGRGANQGGLKEHRGQVGGIAREGGGGGGGLGGGAVVQDRLEPDPPLHVRPSLPPRAHHHRSGGGRGTAILHGGRRHLGRQGHDTVLRKVNNKFGNSAPLPLSVSRFFSSKCARYCSKCAKKCASLKCQLFYCTADFMVLILAW